MTTPTTKIKVDSLHTAYVSSHTTCKLCSNIFTDPRLLPCMHSFCFKCIKDETKSCPTCKKPFEIPEQGLQDLPRDFCKNYEVKVAEIAVMIESSSEVACDRCMDSSDKAAVFCGQCSKFLCGKCKEDHLRHREMCAHKLVSFGAKQEEIMSLFDSIPHKTTSCEMHNDEVLKFVCETCSNKLVCRDCLILQHNGHEYDRVEQVAERGKQELKVLLSETESASDKLQTAIAEANVMIRKIHTKKEVVDKLIKSECQKFHKAVEARQNALLEENNKVSLHKAVSLQNQKFSMTNLKKSIKEVNGKINEALNLMSPAELLSSQGAMASGLKSLNSDFMSFSTDLCQNDIVGTAFDTKSLLTNIDRFGVITEGCSLANSTACLSSSILIQGVKKTMKVTVKDEQGKVARHSKVEVEASLSKDGSGEVATFEGQDQNNGTYLIDIIAQTVGEHNLDVKIHNERIWSSPRQVYVHSQDSYLKMRVSLTINLSGCKPHDVAVSGNKLFIVSSANHIVVASKNNGELLQQISSRSESGHQVGSNSYGIAAQDDILYVSDYKHCCIHKITTTGEYLAQIGSARSGEGQLLGPRGLCVGHDGWLYVAEVISNRISVFELDGTFSRHVTGNMDSPWGIAMDNERNIHVSSYSGNAIAVFNSEGMFIQQYGNGYVYSPTGVAITADDHSIVCNYNSRSICNNTSDLDIFDKKYSFMFCRQDVGQGYGITCDKEGHIFVCDYKCGRLLKY